MPSLLRVKPATALLERFNTAGQARFYLKRKAGKTHDSDAEFEEYAQEHHRIEAAVAQVQREPTGVVKSKIVDRAFLPSFLFADNQLVIVVAGRVRASVVSAFVYRV